MRGSSLRNTEWIYGLVVYTGHETKVMKNQVQGKQKLSKLERSLNGYINLIVVIQFLLSGIAAFFNCLVEVIELKNLTLITGELEADGTHSPMSRFFTKMASQFGFWFILFVNIVPISMVVSLETVKFVQATMI